MGAIDLSGIITKNKYKIILLAALLAVCFDLILEPVAVKLGYWYWAHNIPLQNYLAWFVITLAASYIFEKMRIDYDSNLPRTNYCLQSVFFIVMLILS
jgi:putative membrane protein